jgi:prepilin-type processing-associated H-X9-DG protein
VINHVLQNHAEVASLHSVMEAKYYASRISAFTLLELLAVMASIVIVAAMLLPAFARSDLWSQVTTDLSNKRQLTRAWHMYAEDHNGTLVLNADESVGIDGVPSWIPQPCFMNWTPSPGNTNVTLLMTNELGPYCNGQYKIYTSPGDAYLSPIQRLIFGSAVTHRSRSVAMDAALGGPAGGSGIGAKPPPSLLSLNPFFVATKMDQLMHPGKSWVFADEHPDSVDDDVFYVNPAYSSGTGVIIELPASYLDGGCGISFADGHAEFHKWVTGAFLVPVIYSRQPLPGGKACVGNADLAWFAQHTPTAPQNSPSPEHRW